LFSLQDIVLRQSCIVVLLLPPPAAKPTLLQHDCTTIAQYTAMSKSHFLSSCMAEAKSTVSFGRRRCQRHEPRLSKAFALTWYRALTWYSSPARPFAAPDVPLRVTRQQGSPSPACQQLSRAQNACAGGSREHGTKLKHSTKLERTLCYGLIPNPRNRTSSGPARRRASPRLGRASMASLCPK